VDAPALGLAFRREAGMALYVHSSFLSAFLALEWRFLSALFCVFISVLFNAISNAFLAFVMLAFG
jgi:hypothetical protein